MSGNIVEGNKQPLVSVIVPIYGIERYLGLCIESLLNQDYGNLEIVLVDDGSPDRCPEICDLYAGKDHRIKVIHKENGGLVTARKAGLAASNGEYIANVDGDDWVEEDFISSLLEAILISDSDASVAGHERDFFGKRERLLNVVPFGVYEKERLDALYSGMLSLSDFYGFGIFTYIWNKMFRRDVLYDAQMNVDERISIGEDAACVYPALLACSRIVVTNGCSYHYRQREDSMLKKISPFKGEAPSIRILYEYMLSALEGRHGLPEQLADYILSIYIIRSGGLLPGDGTLVTRFPFGVDIKGTKVAIYSAGTFGQHLRFRLAEANYCEVVGWFDDDYWEYRRCCMDVDPVTEVRRRDFDYLLVAALDPMVSRRIKSEIADMGIPLEKILTVGLNGGRDLALDAYLRYSK